MCAAGRVCRNAGYATLLHHDAVIRCLREAGFSLRLTGHAFAVLDAHLHGFLLQEVSLPLEPGQDLAALGSQMVAAPSEGQLPYFREFTLEHALQPGYDFSDEFEVGLDLVLDGLADRLAGEYRSRTSWSGLLASGCWPSSPGPAATSPRPLLGLCRGQRIDEDPAAEPTRDDTSVVGRRRVAAARGAGRRRCADAAHLRTDRGIRGSRKRAPRPT